MQAEAYTQAYGIIVKDGEATAGQLAEGFKKYAKAAVAANGDVVTAQLKAEAAQRGLTVAVDETGRVTFKSMSDTKEANDKVTRSVTNIRTAYDGISSSASSAGNAMVRAAAEASSAYDKLQAKIKAVKEAQAVEKGDETLRNLRIYGKEEAPTEFRQFANRTGVESFLKAFGLTEEQVIKEVDKLYGSSDINKELNWMALQGNPTDWRKYKSPSVFLGDVAREAQRRSRQREEYENKLSKKDDSDFSSQSVLPQSALDAVSNLNRPQNYETGNNNIGSKSYNVKFTLGGITANASVPESQAELFERMMQELQDSKAIAGY